jgi:hypothetical protein
LDAGKPEINRNTLTVKFYGKTFSFLGADLPREHSLNHSTNKWPKYYDHTVQEFEDHKRREKLYANVKVSKEDIEKVKNDPMAFDKMRKGH